MSIPPRLSTVTLGVLDLERASAFYERLGWKRSGASSSEITFFQLGDMVLGLFPRRLLAEDAAVPANAPQGFCGVTLAMAFASPAEVDAALNSAEAAGARITKPGEATVWGGYSGYFSDPEGFLWEAVHVPQFGIDDQGRLRLPQ
ncbi:MAG TPA: VOC family protein [Aestuariivirgaceae bacterium]|nr:VOC family protein [Aestuariivirgaceae bacterium]